MASGIPARLRSSAYGVLTGAFLRRFFDNEITGGTQDLQASFFWLIGFLAAPLALMPVTRMEAYRRIVLRQGPDALRLLSRPDKMLTILLGMTAAAAIAAVVWNSLMLDRRDGLILGALPVRGRVIVLSKLAALAAYVFGVAAAMHLLSSLIFGLLLSDHAPSVRFMLMSPVAHFTAAVSASSFVFVCIAALQGVVLAVAGPSRFRRVSSLMQVVLVTGLVVGVTKISSVVSAVAQLGADPQTLPASIRWAPPVWFLGLYEWMLGGAAPAYAALARTALVAFAIAAAVAVSTYAAVYRRVMVRGVEAPEDAVRASYASAISDAVVRILSRDQRRRAAAQFFFSSMGRVERLRFIASATLGLLAAWLVPTFAAVVGGDVPRSPATTYGLSYAGLLLAVGGLRIAISMPADLRAAWVTQVIDPPGPVLRSGLWRALFAGGVLPIVAAFTILHAWIFGARVAMVHAALMCAAGALLVELALWHFDDLPSCRPWRPEHANLRMWWPAYLFGFSSMTGIVPQIEWMAHDWLPGSLMLLAAFAGTAVVLRMAHRQPYPPPAFEIETFVAPPSVLNLE